MSGKITRIALWVLFFSFIAVGTAAAQTISLNVQDQPTGSATARIFNIILMITVLSIKQSVLDIQFFNTKPMNLQKTQRSV